jgi:hypothetical protein
MLCCDVASRKQLLVMHAAGLMSDRGIHVPSHPVKACVSLNSTLVPNGIDVSQCERACVHVRVEW